MNQIGLISFLLIIGFLSSPVRAEAIPLEVYKAAMLDLNRSPVTQNPVFSVGKEVLNRRILDKNQRAIGKITDIVLLSDGSFQTLEANINTGGFREDVSFDMKSYIIDPTTSSFTVAMDKSQINNNMATLLSGIETTAGEDAAPITLNRLRGANIFDSQGYIIAKVEDALIRDNINKVEGLLIKVSSGKNRGTTIAVPYEASDIIQKGSRVDLVVTQDQAQVITSLSTR